MNSDWYTRLAISREDHISEDILRTLGFKWHQLDRQPSKHWILWIGGAIDQTSADELGIEVAYWEPNKDWFCWLRDDLAGRYARFVHIRHIRTVHELHLLIEGLTGQPFDPAHVWYGSLRTPAQSAYLAREDGRLDRRLMLERPHASIEKDDSRGGALPEHLEHHAKTS
jgi:hypothetical protein